MVELGTDRDTGLIIRFEGRSFTSKGLSILLEDDKRNRDICGPDIGYVMRKTGWFFTGKPVCICAYEGNSIVPVSAAWVAPIRWETATGGEGKDSLSGVNFSYATSQNFAGNGLTKILTSTAYLCALESQLICPDADLNIQCDRSNEASIGVAQSLGFTRNPDCDFNVRGLKLKYWAFNSKADRFKAYATEVLERRLLPCVIESPSLRESVICNR
jgi:hypothetical protein